jgi:hypothetical protein
MYSIEVMKKVAKISHAWKGINNQNPSMDLHNDTYKN